MNSTVLVTEPEWGWPNGVEFVEVERVTPRGDTYAVDKVFVNARHVGWVVGRYSVFHTRQRDWDYVVGEQEPDATNQVRLVYGHSSRQHALTSLCEAWDGRKP